MELVIRCSRVQRIISRGRLQPHGAKLDDRSPDMMLRRGGSTGQGHEDIFSGWRWCPMFDEETAADSTTLSYFLSVSV